MKIRRIKVILKKIIGAGFVVTLTFLLVLGCIMSPQKEGTTNKVNVQKKEALVKKEEKKDTQTKPVKSTTVTANKEADKEPVEPKEENIEEAPVVVEPESVEVQAVPEPIEEEPVEVEDETPEPSEPVQEEVYIEPETMGDYVGTYSITAYTWTGNTMANREYPYVGCVASCDFALGTTLFIEGIGTFVVNDVCPSSGVIDIYMDSYEECINFGRTSANVYVQ